MFRSTLSLLLNLFLFLLVLIPAVPLILLAFALLLAIVGVTLLPSVWRTPFTTTVLIVGFGFFTLLFTWLLTFGRVPIGYNLRNLVVRW